MIPHVSEAIVLRTWPFRESDLLVSLFTRDLGKVRGVAKAALKSRKRFGGALEPMTYVRAAYAEKPRQELVRLEHFEIIASPLAQPIDYLRAATLAFYAEVLESVLPDHDAQDAMFRLALTVLEETRVASCWLPLTYFSLWVTRLAGWLPEVDRCSECGELFGEAAVFYHGLTDGLTCANHKRPNNRILSLESLVAAQRILREPISRMGSQPWTRQNGHDLRRFLSHTLERHVERRLNSAAALARLGG